MPKEGGEMKDKLEVGGIGFLDGVLFGCLGSVSHLEFVWLVNFQTGTTSHLVFFSSFCFVG